jgi:hypothetical protein
MKQSSDQFTFSAGWAVAAAALLATLAFTPGHVLAATDPGVERVEARIENMHDRLKITHAQEEQWSKVAQSMRDNAKEMEALTKARSERTGTMTAVDDLQSYGEITDAHAEGVKRFTPIFAVLYAQMSDEQKKDADEMFRHRESRKSKSKSK